MGREDPHFRLRIPAALKAEIEASAAANTRSMTAEIIARLSGSERSLRDWFAGQALVALCNPPGLNVPNQKLAEVAYALAAAMIAEREKSRG